MLYQNQLSHSDKLHIRKFSLLYDTQLKTKEHKHLAEYVGSLHGCSQYRPNPTHEILINFGTNNSEEIRQFLKFGKIPCPICLILLNSWEYFLNSAKCACRIWLTLPNLQSLQRFLLILQNAQKRCLFCKLGKYYCLFWKIGNYPNSA